ncbi:6-hydroxymethylpterin diphosphokinase MptE-like protein [Neptunicoccus cionae]|uniref:6-hydroxymethylpterin diphosphokinase MptE-like domain-containing protein n=1 Tax=Neptunicoccus cionae TaxID=2035344 RepID=A0A916R2K4_9RHOB|nr:6-hydroxymethylpterin diphosphokinase MptE-like protein [Amylibacter cionae]GGA29244.1 hypothetical protein GCM10011498_33000 [Amylibacter cionae]
MSDQKLQKKRVLIFTDSRGQHKPAGTSHELFAERLAADPRLDVDLYLCPMKWTTTLDFLETFSENELKQYDHVILYTGIVEWSPRPASSAINDLYNNPKPQNADNLALNTRDYSKKIVNNKKKIFDKVFGAEALKDHFDTPFEQEYEGEKTNNMYSIEMARRDLLPRLKKINNLIFVSANRFVPDWEGDFKRGRPRNIDITHQYSDLFAEELGQAGMSVVDLRAWDNDQIKNFTCDNIHLTETGSNYVYDQISNLIFNDLFDANKPDKAILLIGNGPSSKILLERGFENLPRNIDTFGCGAAYRLFQELKWWPKYYAWCDAKVVKSHAQELRRISEDPSIPTDFFYFSLKVSPIKRQIKVPHGSTGDFLLRKAVNFGYKKIYMIGMEGSYTEEVVGSRPITAEEYNELDLDSLRSEMKGALALEKGPTGLFFETIRVIEHSPTKNPNYFFEGYQRKGDLYSLPRSQTHQNAWKKSADYARKQGAEVINLSPISKITEFFNADFLTSLFPSTQVIPSLEFPIVDAKPVSSQRAMEARALADVGPTDPIATAIIAIKIKANEPDRIENLAVVVNWLDRCYGNLIDLLIIEQDLNSKWADVSHLMPSRVRHEFIFNPKPFNRGWAYNASVRHFCKTDVVCLMDSDVLPGENFLTDILRCYNGKSLVSPYTYIHYSSPTETKQIRSEKAVEVISTPNIQKPTTLTGGIVIIRRDIYNSLKGFEQYIEYAGEDRALDVTVLNHLPPESIVQSPFTYVHLHHSVGGEPRPHAPELFRHLRENFGCRVAKDIGPTDYVHGQCNHVGKEKTLAMMLERTQSYGDLDLYRSDKKLPINGIKSPARVENLSEDLIFPPNFKDLGSYPKQELYGNTPPPDGDELARFHNRFQGQRCFIVGNGPSLNQHDLSLLEGEYSFAVNSIYYKTRENGFRPTFFVVEDSSVMKENIGEIVAYEAPYKFFPTIYSKLHPKTPNTFFFEMNRGFYEKTSPNYAVPRFSTDASKVLYCGQSVTYINLQLAFFMGFTEVYLIGMDFDYVIPESHKRNGDNILSTTDDPNHFHKDYFGKGKTWKDPKLERVLMNYKMADLAYSAVGRTIYNATVGGKLEVFERVDYSSLFGGGPVTRPAAAINPEPVSSFGAKEVRVDPTDLSITQAHALFNAGEFTKCAEICDALYQERKLNMYKQFAEYARQQS